MMNLKKKKIIIILIFILMLALILISVFSRKNISNSSTLDKAEEKKYVYEFDQILNLETEKGLEETENIGTEYSNLGVITDFYHDNDIEYEGEEIHLTSFEGNKIVSFAWPEEAEEKEAFRYLKEPEFGILNRIIAESDYSKVTIVYEEVSMKNVESYLNVLAGYGFTNVEKKDKNKNKDYYNFIATNQENKRVVINYAEGIMNLKLM